MFKNLEIGKRLIVAFVVVALLTSVAGVMGLGLLLKLDKDYGTALVQNGFVQGDIGNYNTYLNKGGAVVRDIISFTSIEDTEVAVAELEDIKLKTQEGLDALAVNCQSPQELAIVSKLNELMEKYKPLRDKAVELGVKGKTYEALSYFHSDARPVLNECLATGQELMALNIEMGKNESAQLTAASRVGVIAMVAVIAIGLLAAIIIALAISRGISKPIAEIEQAAVEMAKGDYDVTILYSSGDEIGSLANSMRNMMSVTKGVVLDAVRGLGEIAGGNFNIKPEAEYIGIYSGLETAIARIIEDLSATMSQIKMSSDQVFSGAEQVASGAQALAQGATEQASTVQELSASINEVSSQVKSNAENAATASTLAVNAGEGLVTSNHQMSNMIQAMSEISESSSKISKIIKTIEDIAFQTNILALNAAVEAARAGAAGKGFAVVADEVRNLATKSSEAAKQTNLLIEGSVKSVEHGVEIAGETAQSLNQVVTGARKMSDLIVKISEASKEQSMSISQINLSIEQISSVVQTNSATSEESAAASEELSAQSSTMKGLVSKFKLKGGVGDTVLLGQKYAHHDSFAPSRERSSKY